MPVNTASLKTFAPAMRRQLLEAVGRKLDLLLNSQTPDTLSTYSRQIAELREQEAENREQLLERVAYTWFNRLCALRYLDARGWHPFGCKVLMPAGEGETQPELLKLMRAGSLPAELKSHTNEARLHGLLDGQIPPAVAGADPQGEVYRELLMASCRSYHELLPNLFEVLDDASELLLPDDLLTEGSIAGGFRTEIRDGDCLDVEIIGWLYQFYISEKKAQVMARKRTVPPEDIPAVTQLFTPNWIVRYLIENTLGRLWLRSRPDSRIKEHLAYYVEDLGEQVLTNVLTVSNPEEIKLLDPACGSGHILLYAFDLLVKIYEEDGHSINEIPEKILSNNLFGLDICPRAAQLASFALLCKARDHSRRAFRSPMQPKIICLQDVHLAPGEVKDYIDASGIQFNQQELAQIHQFRENSETFGSLVQPVLDNEKLATLKSKISERGPADSLLVETTHHKLSCIIDQAEMLSSRYQVVVANPPYMGSAQQSPLQTDTLKSLFPDSWEDLFACFVERSLMLATEKGLIGMIVQQSLMFIKGFTGLRRRLLEEKHLESLVLNGYGVFGADFGTCGFVLQNGKEARRSSAFFSLRDAAGNDEKALSLRTKTKMFVRNPSIFMELPQAQIAFWISDNLISAFKKQQELESIAPVRQGFQTGDNARFLRQWQEIGFNSLKTNASSSSEFFDSGKRWAPYNKGGSFRKWFGNREQVVTYSRADFDILAQCGNRLPSRNRYFLPSVTWSAVTVGKFSARYSPPGSTFSSGGACAFPSDEDIPFVVALLNSKVVEELMTFMGATINFNVGSIRQIPLVETESKSMIAKIAAAAIDIARAHWNNSETSWDFLDLPLLRSGNWAVASSDQARGVWGGTALAESWINYAEYCNSSICVLRELETENNRLWIDAYGLQGEISPNVPEEEVTLARAEVGKDIASCISYAIGCMVGRYSLDQPGLILADSRESQAEQLVAYEAKVGKPLSEVQFKPDPDGIIPVLEGEWFEDDIVARTREFLAVTFPESSVAENLRFIEESLGKDIRKYFCSDFYKDHLQTYKKRPIYWMVQSPRKGFACLIYLHRYTKDTLNQVLNNYFRPYLQKLEARLAQLGLDQLNDELPARERTAARKEAEKITKVLKECQAWEQDALLPLAQQRIALDLDEGVKVNYLKLQDVLAPIPGLAAKED